MKKSKRPKASEREDGVDFISKMPDSILVLILSRLQSTEEDIRSSILSRRWRYVWTAVPSLDMSFIDGGKLKDSGFKEFVYWVLANKTVDLDSFRLCCNGYNYNISTVWRWIHIAITKNVKQLDLTFCTKETNKEIELPHYLVTCISLEVLRLNLSFRFLKLPTMGFTALRVLVLANVDLGEDQYLVRIFLKSCPLLEDLALLDCLMCTLNYLCISCPKLKRLNIINWVDEGGSGILISCPKLVELNITGYGCNFYFECLDSLKKFVYKPILENINADHVLFEECFLVKPLWMDLYLFQMGAACGLALPNLKTMVLKTTIDAFTYHELIQFLIYCPKLESLKLTITQKFSLPQELHEGDARIIFTHDLKRVKLFEFNGERPKLVIYWHSCSYNELLEMVFSWGNEARSSHS